LRLRPAPVMVGVGAPEARYFPIPAVELEEEEPRAARALGPVVSRLVPNHLCHSRRSASNPHQRRGETGCSRRPVLVPLFLPPPLLIHPQPITLLSLQPLRQPLLVSLERISKHLDVDQRDGFEGSICRRVDRDSLNFVEDVLTSDETAKDRVLAFTERLDESVKQTDMSPTIRNSPFRWSQRSRNVMKNWLPFVLGPLFAIDSTPRWSCLSAGSTTSKS
jgi:hypothetical protein